jgi:hypothetical protein
MLPSDEIMLRAFGGLLAVAGIILLLSNKVRGSTRLKAFGIEIETAAPAFLILLLGCALFVLPSFMPERFASPPENEEPADYRAYDLVQDDTGQLSFLAPSDWGHHIGRGWHPLNLPPYAQGERIGPGVNAAPNFDAWFEDLKTPGVFVAASARVVSDAQYTPETLGSFFGYRGCVFERRSAYQSSQPRLTGI